MNDRLLRKLERSHAEGRKVINSLRLSQKEREWVEREAEQLVSYFTKALSERLEPGVSFEAIPAVFAFALAVVKASYKRENGRNFKI